MISNRCRFSLAALLLICGVTVAPAQVIKAPRYQSTVDAPAQQVNLPALPPAITPHGTVVEDVVVRINDQIISRSDVERASEQMQQEAQQSSLAPADVALRQKDMLRDMIDQQLLLSRAKELGLNADADLVRRLDEIRKQNKMDTLDDLEKAAKQQGVSFEDFKAQIRNQILTQQVVRDEVGRRLQVTQSDEAKYYAEHAKEFEQPEQIRLSEILIPLPETATPAEIAQAEAKANDVKTKMTQGADFADLAKKFSGGPSAAQGGELGLFKRGALAKVLEDQTFGLPVGASTQPVRTRQGFVILKVTEHETAGPAPLKQVEPQIQEAMYMQAMQPALRAYLTKLREDAYIDLQPGFNDSGASSRETKPVFTAYAPPVAKKKKVKSKARFDRGGRSSAVAQQTKQATSSPDATGTRTLTGAEAKTAVDPNTGLAALPATRNTLTTNAAVPAGRKQRRVRREKIRFGQAPRESLPAGTEDASTVPDAAGAPVNTLAAPAATPAPGSALAGAGGAQESSSAATGDVAENASPALAPEPKKTRFSARAGAEKEKKVAVLSAKKREKLAALPTPITADEKTAIQTQSAPLGLSGDTAKRKKVKKVKRPKGTAKQRLQDKQPEQKKPETPVDPTASPNLAPTAATGESTRPAAVPETPPNSSVPRAQPNEPDTTLPPANDKDQGKDF